MLKINNYYGTASLNSIQSSYISLQDFLDGKKSKKTTITGALVCSAKFERDDNEKEYLELFTEEDGRIMSYNFEDIDLFKKISLLFKSGNGLEVEIKKDGRYAKISEVKEKD